MLFKCLYSFSCDVLKVKILYIKGHFLVGGISWYGIVSPDHKIQETLLASRS